MSNNRDNLSLAHEGNYTGVSLTHYNGGALASAGQFVRLECHPQNRHDRNAICVVDGDDVMIGHIRSSESRHLAPVLDSARVDYIIVNAYIFGDIYPHRLKIEVKVYLERE